MPGGDFHPWFFVIVAAWVLVCGLGVVLFRRIMYSAVSMVFCFLGVAFAYALLNAPLVAIIQILVYVGAISIVIIFAIMLTEVQHGGMELFFNRQTAVAAVVALVGAAVLAVVALSADIGRDRRQVAARRACASSPGSSSTATCSRSSSSRWCSWPR